MLTPFEYLELRLYMFLEQIANRDMKSVRTLMRPQIILSFIAEIEQIKAKQSVEDYFVSIAALPLESDYGTKLRALKFHGMLWSERDKGVTYKGNAHDYLMRLEYWLNFYTLKTT